MSVRFVCDACGEDAGPRQSPAQEHRGTRDLVEDTMLNKPTGTTKVKITIIADGVDDLCGNCLRRAAAQVLGLPIEEDE